MICPAFQSSFIYDDVKRDALFAYFGEDSLPSLHGFTNKNKYGIIEESSKRKKRDGMRVVRMERIYPQEDVNDSISNDSSAMALNTPQEGGVGDLDSLVNAPPEKKYHYNVEQANYNRLFGKYLYTPPPPDPEEDEEELAQDALPQEEEQEDLTRKERRQARKEARAQEKEEASKGGTSNTQIK